MTQSIKISFSTCLFDWPIKQFSRPEFDLVMKSLKKTHATIGKILSQMELSDGCAIMLGRQKLLESAQVRIDIEEDNAKHEEPFITYRLR